MSAYRRRRDRGTIAARAENIRSQIIDAAIEIVGGGGLSALTIDRLAARLHRRQTSIGRHFGNIDEISDAVTVRAQQELVELLRYAIGGRVGRQALEALLEAQRLYAQARPGMYEAALRRPSVITPEVVRVEEAYLKVECEALQASGASPREASRLAWCLRAALQGAISLEANNRLTAPHEIDQHFDQIVSLLEAASRSSSPPVVRPSPAPARPALMYGADRA